MYLVVIAWTYVAVMMAVAEATSTQGSVLGGMVTFVLYGVVPMTLVVYLMRTPARRKAMRAREAAERAAHQATLAQGSGAAPDAGSHAAADAVAPMRKEP
nr:hypothetical protein [Pseudorhodoferax sp. Leaf267]